MSHVPLLLASYVALLLAFASCVAMEPSAKRDCRAKFGGWWTETYDPAGVLVHANCEVR